MNLDPPKIPRSHGTGEFAPNQFAHLGRDVVLEAGILAFHPEHIEIGDRVYVGHRTILKAYHRNRLIIGDDSWIGQDCFLHSAGGITIGRAVGIGPTVKILTSSHRADDLNRPVLFTELDASPVLLEDGCDLGVGSIVLPGVTVGEGSIVGAGSVVTASIPPYEVWAGVPARKLRSR